jgi:pimeloyl-ACP methyl ester carboxylesterase
VRRAAVALAVVAALLAAVGFLASRYDQPPATPGAWLEASGLEARYARVAGHRLRYVRVGRGPAVVLIHGLGSSLYTWKDVLPTLVPGHDVVALDLPGFGGSDRPEGLTFEELPAAVRGLMNELGIDRAALAGNSLGGAVAAVLAAEQTRRVSALVLIDAVGFNLDPGEAPGVVRLAMSPVAPLLARLPLTRLFVELSLRQVFFDDSHVTDERVAEYMQGLRRPGALASIRSLGRSLQEQGGIVQKGLPRIEAPTLVVWGREDQWIPLSDAERFVDAIPGARKVVIDGCGHMPQAEKPEAVGRLLRELVANSSGRSHRSGDGNPESSRGLTDRSGLPEGERRPSGLE